MCGICGVRRFSDQPIDRSMIDLLILNNANRGLEATGIALQQADGSVQVYKDNVVPFEFLASQDYEEFMQTNLREDTITAIGHTRKATKGSPRMINNNHPMYAGKVAVVHNGVIHNDDSMFKDLKLERRAETDSDIIRAILDDEGFSKKAINTLARLAGSAAIAAVHPDYPGKLLLGRSGSPLEMAATPDYLMFSSEKGPIMKALRPYRNAFGVQMRVMTPINYCMIGMNDHSAWLFGDKPKGKAKNWDADWLEWHQEMKIAQGYTPINYTCHAQYHGNRVKFYDDRPVDVVRCQDCGVYATVASALLQDLKKYDCWNCGKKLA